MNTLEAFGKPGRALEITVALAGRRVGLWGFDPVEAERISAVFRGIRSVAMPMDERLLSDSARICDALIVKLGGLEAEALRAAAVSRVPVLVMGSSQAVLEGAGGAYRWSRHFINDPWSEAELLVRLFRMFEPVGSTPDAGERESRSEPLVLLADDDPELIALVELTLHNDGIRCRTADNGLTALRIARELVPDLVLLDIRMPVMDGFEVLETIRRDPNLQTIPVILLTGCHDTADVMRGSELHADAYIGKPVSSNILLTRVKRLLSTHATGDRRWSWSLPATAGSSERVTSRWIPSSSSRDLPEVERQP